MKNKNSSFYKSCIYASVLTIVAVVTMTGITVVPKGIKYNVKETQANTAVGVKKEVTKREYQLRSYGNKICVVLDGNILYELDITTQDVSEYDRRRLEEGIVFDDENELYSLKEYLES